MCRCIMLRTGVSLTQDERRLLDEESQRTGRSIAALIRDREADGEAHVERSPHREPAQTDSDSDSHQGALMT